MTEYIVKIDPKVAKDLERRISSAQYEFRRPTRDTGYYTELLVDAVDGFKVEIFAHEHPPPHFRVAVGSSTANYSIEDFRQLNGSGEVLRYRRQVHAWWKENKGLLINTWNERRPSDCPVGKIGAPTPRKRKVKHTKNC